MGTPLLLNLDTDDKVAVPVVIPLKVVILAKPESPYLPCFA
jgi:hypothetical protein